MITLQKFQTELAALSNFSTCTFLLAVSGGVDSMVLANLFLKSKISFEIAHVNYKLRGEDSQKDQKVVEEFCKENQIKFHLYSVSEKDNKPKNSIELWARDIRYKFFNEIISKTSINYIVTAHHLNDQFETMIINLSRGTGVKGLTGISNLNGKIIRPLLNFTKEELYNFAEENRINFREDLSNAETDFYRNRIRHFFEQEKIRSGENYIEGWKKSLENLSITSDFISEKTEEVFVNISKISDDCITINKSELQNQHPLLQFEILRKFGFANNLENSKIFVAQTGSLFLSDSYNLIVNRNELLFSPITIIEDLNEVIQLEILQTSEEFSLSKFATSEETIWKLNKDNLQFPLFLRRKKEGDLFYPTGMKGSKKISKFFKDEKFSILAKRKSWLLTDATNEIIGILPHRQDRRFLPNAESKNVLTITF